MTTDVPRSTSWDRDTMTLHPPTTNPHPPNLHNDHRWSTQAVFLTASCSLNLAPVITWPTIFVNLQYWSPALENLSPEMDSIQWWCDTQYKCSCFINRYTSIEQYFWVGLSSHWIWRKSQTLGFENLKFDAECSWSGTALGRGILKSSTWWWHRCDFYKKQMLL
jgi:hypothetical protein